jgi:preprotein translocase subunit SecD
MEMISFLRIVPVTMLCLAAMSEAKAANGPKATVEIRRAETAPADGLTEAKVASTDEKVYLHKAAELTNEDIASARRTNDGLGGAAIEVILTEAGGKKMFKLTGQHLNKPLAVLLDGKVICAPIIRAKITDHAMLTGQFTAENIDQFVKSVGAK